MSTQTERLPVGLAILVHVDLLEHHLVRGRLDVGVGTIYAHHHA